MKPIAQLAVKTLVAFKGNTSLLNQPLASSESKIGIFKYLKGSE